MTYKLASAMAVCAATLLFASPGYSAEEQHGKHQQQATGDQQMGSAGSKALHDAMSSGMEKMHKMKMTGKTDHDFATMMIQHHEQAIAMSKAELAHGADPEVQKKAREIVAASEKDIAELKKWQQHH